MTYVTGPSSSPPAGMPASCGVVLVSGAARMPGYTGPRAVRIIGRRQRGVSRSGLVARTRSATEAAQLGLIAAPELATPDTGLGPTGTSIVSSGPGGTTTVPAATPSLVVTSVSPAPTAGKAGLIHVYGTGFVTAGTAVRTNRPDVLASGWSVVSPTQMTAQLWADPTATGSVQVWVETVAGRSNAVTLNITPAPLSVSPPPPTDTGGMVTEPPPNVLTITDVGGGSQPVKACGEPGGPLDCNAPSAPAPSQPAAPTTPATPASAQVQTVAAPAGNASAGGGGAAPSTQLVPQTPAAGDSMPATSSASMPAPAGGAVGPSMVDQVVSFTKAHPYGVTAGVLALVLIFSRQGGR